MTGDLQIKRISLPAETPATFELLFQTEDRETLTGSTAARDLPQFLREKLRLSPDEVDRAVKEIEQRGHATLKHRDIEATDLVGSGMRYLPDEG